MSSLASVSLQRNDTVHDTLVDNTGHGSPLDSSNVSSNVASKETQTTYQPSTGTDPSGRMDHKQRIAEVKREMSGRWVERDKSLLDSFFPRESISQGNIEHVKRELYNPKTKRWQGIPKDVSNEKVLVRAFLKILQAIQRHGDIGPDRDVLDTQDHNIPTHDGANLRPDLFISALDALISPVTVHEEQPTSFKQCLGIIEAKRHKHQHHAEDAAQLAIYSREVLVAQSNRRFVPSFLITERFLKFFVFDRSGAMSSSKFDYHKYPDRACEILFSLLHSDTASLGFDHTVFFRTPSSQCIRTTERVGGSSKDQETTYIVEALMMRSYTIVGSGTTYWRARRECNSSSSNGFVIKDSWRTLDMEDEETLFRDAGNNGHIASLVHTEIVLTREGGMDTTICSSVPVDCQREVRVRTHTRSVYRSSGKLLEHFVNPMEVLVSFYHAIKGHGLLLAQGIHFPDIVLWNILIPPMKSEDHGALIDLDHARKAASPSPRNERTPGSWFFLSRSALEGSTTTSHIEDLESFFYIFCFIVVAHTGPLLASSRIQNSGELEAYGLTKRPALGEKRSLIALDTFKYTVQTEYFKEPIAQLAVDLHYFFHSRWECERDAAAAGKALALPDAAEDYHEFIAHIDTAIKRLAIICGKLHPLGKANAASAPIPLDTVVGHIEELTEQGMAREARKRSFFTALGDDGSDLCPECKRPRL